MKKASSKSSSDDLRKEYVFDYSKARKNRFATRVTPETVVVVLEPDVASVFHSSEVVNRFLRSAINAMPAKQPKRKSSVSALRKRGG